MNLELERIIYNYNSTNPLSNCILRIGATHVDIGYLHLRDAIECDVSTIIKCNHVIVQHHFLVLATNVWIVTPFFAEDATI